MKLWIWHTGRSHVLKHFLSEQSKISKVCWHHLVAGEIGSDRTIVLIITVLITKIIIRIEIVAKVIVVSIVILIIGVVVLWIVKIFIVTVIIESSTITIVVIISRAVITIRKK